MAQYQWQTVQDYARLKEACDRQGFEAVQFQNGRIVIRTPMNTDRPPYAKGVNICYAQTFKGALLFMEGYEQRIFELKYSQDITQ
jgi:hypothetical protein